MSILHSGSSLKQKLTNIELSPIRVGITFLQALHLNLILRQRARQLRLDQLPLRVLSPSHLILPLHVPVQLTTTIRPFQQALYPFQSSPTPKTPTPEPEQLSAPEKDSALTTPKKRRRPRPSQAKRQRLAKKNQELHELLDRDSQNH